MRTHTAFFVRYVHAFRFCRDFIIADARKHDLSALSGLKIVREVRPRTIWDTQPQIVGDLYKFSISLNKYIVP